MTKARLLAPLLSLALALAGTTAVLAQDEDLGPFEDAEQLGFAQEFYSDYAEAMSESGIAGESLDFATDWLQTWYGGTEDMDVDADEASSGEMADEADMSEEEAAALKDEMDDDE